MNIVLWAAGATGLSGFLAYLWIREKAKRNQERKALHRIIDQKEAELEVERKKVQQHRHAIKAMEEVNAGAAKKKREIRKHSKPIDRANAATDVMSELARNGDSNKDGTASSD